MRRAVSYLFIAALGLGPELAIVLFDGRYAFGIVSVQFLLVFLLALRQSPTGWGKMAFAAALIPSYAAADFLLKDVPADGNGLILAAMLAAPKAIVLICILSRLDEVEGKAPAAQHRD